MNLAGVERVFQLEGKLHPACRARSTPWSAAPRQLLEEIGRLEEVRRSVRAEIVRYEAPGTALIPIRHVRREGLTGRSAGSARRMPR